MNYIMPPYYGLNNTNQKNIINNLLKCQQSFYNVDNSDITGLGADAIRNCRGSIYNTNNGLYALNTQNFEGLCCPRNEYEGKLFTSQSTKINRSYLSRTSTYLQSAQGGRPSFININTEQPFNVNYLGRVQGQLGGSGAPPRNRF